MLRLILIFLAIFVSTARAQITGPSAVDFPIGCYQTNAVDISGSVLSWYGWNLGQKSSFNRPLLIRVRVDSVGGIYCKWRIAVNYSGMVDTIYCVQMKKAAFWLPVGASGIPDSLIYIVPDSIGMVVGDEFQISSLKIQPGDQYNFRLLFSTDSIKGTATTMSQPVWIGDGVDKLVFGYQPADTVKAVYRAIYSNAYAGSYLYFFSADTLADTTWTKAREAGAWNYQTASGIDNARWLRVERIGKVAADTVRINGEQIYIRSK